MAEEKKDAPPADGAAAGAEGEVDEEGQPLLDKADEADDSEGCCFYYGQCILAVFMFMLNGVRYMCSCFGDVFGLCWYPFKERMADCCECCGKRLKPE